MSIIKSTLWLADAECLEVNIVIILGVVNEVTEILTPNLIVDALTDYAL